jgi:hypothetical protein
MLRMLSFVVADMWCLSVEEEGELLMLDVARNMSRCFDDVATFCLSCFICYSNMLRHMHINVSLWFSKCCECWVSMLQTCNVGCCVKEGREGSWCWMLHATQVATWSHHSATCGGGGKKDARCCMLHKTSFATCSEYVRNMLATSFVECCKDDGSQHRKSSSQHRKSCSQHLLRLATRSATDRLPSSESCGPGPVRC